MSNKRSEDLKFIHILRTVSVTMVCWDHMVPATYFALGMQPPASAIYRFVIWPLAITNYFGALAVDIFFLITGYLTMKSVGKYKPVEFLMRRFVRLCPSIAFGWLAYTGLAGLLKIICGGRSDWFAQPYFPVNGALWFLRVLIVFYVLVAICIPLFKKSVFYGCLMVGLLSALGSQIGASQSLPYIYIYIPWLGAAFSYVFYILVGAAFYFMLEGSDGAGRPAQGLILAAIGWIGIVYYNIAVYNPERADVGNSFGVSAMYAILLFLVLALAEDRLSAAKIVKAISKHSYGIFVYHMPAYHVVLAVCQYVIPVKDNGRLWPFVAAVTAISVLISAGMSWISNRWIDKPCNGLLHKLLRRMDHGENKDSCLLS